MSSPLSELRTLRIAGYLEGVSYLALLGIAMPLKYVYGQPEFVRIIGALHGFLFLWYVYAGLSLGRKLGWPKTRFVALIAASILPFGPFVFDRQLGREEGQASS